MEIHFNIRYNDRGEKLQVRQTKESPRGGSRGGEGGGGGGHRGHVPPPSVPLIIYSCYVIVPCNC